MTRPVPYSVALTLGLVPLAAACSSQPAAEISARRAKDVESLPGPDGGAESAPGLITGQGPTTEETTTTTIVASAPATSNETVVVFEVPEPVTVWLPEDETDEAWWAAERERSSLLSCIRSHEGDYTTDTGNGYSGAYQFDADTWASVGGTGNPAEATPQEQDDRAWRLYQERGLSPWPIPQAMC